jgi:hypothetical protein
VVGKCDNLERAMSLRNVLHLPDFAKQHNGGGSREKDLYHTWGKKQFVKYLLLNLMRFSMGNFGHQRLNVATISMHFQIENLPDEDSFYSSVYLKC